MDQIPPKKLHFVIFLTLILIIPAVSAADTTIQFQNLGLTNQNLVVFDAAGTDVFHGNTSSTITMDWNLSEFYTVQFQPTPVNVAPETMMESILNILSQYWLPLILIIAIIIAIAKVL
jgi:hypothetical protein